MKTLSLELAYCLTLLMFAIQTARAAEPARQPTIVLISGEYEYDSARTLPAFKQYLATNYGFNCIYLERTKGEDRCNNRNINPAKNRRYLYQLRP